MRDLHDYYDDAAVAEAASFWIWFVLFGRLACRLCGLFFVFFEEEFAYRDAAYTHVFFVAVAALAEDADGIFSLYELLLGAVFRLHIRLAIDDSRAGSSAT